MTARMDSLERGLRVAGTGWMGKRGRPGTVPTLRELECVSAYARLGDRQRVADEMGISVHTVRNLLESIYGRLDVICAVDAFTALGWLTPESPEDAYRRLTTRPAAVA